MRTVRTNADEADVVDMEPMEARITVSDRAGQVKAVVVEFAESGLYGVGLDKLLAFLLHLKCTDAVAAFVATLSFADEDEDNAETDAEDTGSGCPCTDDSSPARLDLDEV